MNCFLGSASGSNVGLGSSCLSGVVDGVGCAGGVGCVHIDGYKTYCGSLLSWTWEQMNVGLSSPASAVWYKHLKASENSKFEDGLSRCYECIFAKPEG